MGEGERSSSHGIEVIKYRDKKKEVVVEFEDSEKA
jgi:hypothetical protein